MPSAIPIVSAVNSLPDGPMTDAFFFRQRRTIVRIAPSLAELEGLEDAETPEWVIDKLEQADFDALKAYAFRETPLPAGSPA